MYCVAVRRNFVAQHFLIGGDWGAENEWHSHHYITEVQLHGHALNEHGYLVDIVAIEAHLDQLVAYYKDKTLNDLPEFAGLNPSIEQLARLMCEALAQQLTAANVRHITVKIWENDIAWASYTKEAIS